MLFQPLSLRRISFLPPFARSMAGLLVNNIIVGMFATPLWFASSSRKVVVQQVSVLPNTGSWDPEPLDSFDPTSIVSTWSEGDVEDFGGVVQGPQVFEKSNDYCRIKHAPAVYGKDVESSSVQSETNNLKVSANLEASFGFFTGKVQGDVARRLTEYQHFYQTDREVFVQRAVFTRRTFYPPGHLMPEARKFLDEWSPSTIRSQFGDFWVKEVSVGGRLRRRMTMTLNKKVSETEVFGKISGEMNKAAFKLGAEAEVDVQWSDSSIESKTVTYFKALGGDDLSMWFNFNGNNFDEIQQEWADAMHNAGSEGSKYTEVKMKLEPLWTLIGIWDTNKSQEVQNYYRGLWAEDAEKLKQWEEFMATRPTPAPTTPRRRRSSPRRRRLPLCDPCNKTNVCWDRAVCWG